MCLSNSRKYVKPKNFIEGYKVLVTKGERWKSYHAQQLWGFAELVKARLPRYIGFSGERSYKYRRGIHAYNTLTNAQEVFGRHESPLLFVKVLLFGVTHYDRKCYRADSAIIIETLNGRTGERIPWPGG